MFPVSVHVGIVTAFAVAVATGSADGLAGAGVAEGRPDAGALLAGAGLVANAQAETRIPTTIGVATRMSRERIGVSFRQPTTAR
jgi:hypothetical protein